jgi:hypothetical protein
MVTLIALLQTVPLFIAGHLARNKRTALTTTLLVMLTVVSITGKKRYLVTDATILVCAYLIAFVLYGGKRELREASDRRGKTTRAQARRVPPSSNQQGASPPPHQQADESDFSSQAKTSRPSESDYRRILGLADNFTPEDLRKQYRELMTQYHPDKVAHLGPELRKLAHDKALQINQAYSYFSGKR